MCGIFEKVNSRLGRRDAVERGGERHAVSHIALGPGFGERTSALNVRYSYTFARFSIPRLLASALGLAGEPSFVNWGGG